jgi:hypothetical protein
MILAGVFFLISIVFVWRSFYGMRIGTEVTPAMAQVRELPAHDAQAAAQQAIPSEQFLKH